MQDFSHENVLSLLAVVMDEGRPYVVLPFMEYGDLKSYVSDPSRVSEYVCINFKRVKPSLFFLKF